MKQNQTSQKKKSYGAPSLRKINLAADEVLAVGCKTNQGGFNVGGSPCMANRCVKNGS